MDNFRQTSEHVSDIKATIAWARRELKLPVWLIGTSRGTQSVAYAATQLPLAEGGPDGIVLTSSILFDRRSRPVPSMALDHINVPVLVAHHRLDSCRACQFSDLPNLTRKLSASVMSVMKTPEVRNRLEQFGYDPIGNSAAEFAATLRADIDKFAHVIKAAGIKADL